MRAAVGPFLVFAILACAWACGTEAGTDTTVPDEGEDAGRIDLAYCTRYCDAQAKAGTLTGSRTDCLRKCCKNGSEDCVVPASDGGSTPTEGDASTTAPDGSACAAPCGTTCCQGGQACNVEPGGTPTCVKTCAIGSDCSPSCCAPATNDKGDPVGPYVCKPNDGKPYHCCNGITNTCSGGAQSCCVVDAKNNQFCATECQSNQPCGAGRCGGYTFSTLNTRCKGPTACGP
jgi:hypothetical protein